MQNKYSQSMFPENVLVPLPETIDSDFRIEVLDARKNVGFQPASLGIPPESFFHEDMPKSFHQHYHSIKATSTGVYFLLTKHIHHSILDTFHPALPQSEFAYATRCVFPGEDLVAVCRHDASYSSLPDIRSVLCEIISRVSAWFYVNLSCQEPRQWGNGSKSEAWEAWRRNPRFEALWIVAIRRAEVSNEHGTTYIYFPEVEIRP